jgi:hypothetical protein
MKCRSKPADCEHHERLRGYCCQLRLKDRGAASIITASLFVSDFRQRPEAAVPRRDLRPVLVNAG